MAKIILICGKICSGKTTYAKTLIRSNPAVLLSKDELTVAFFGTDAGEDHDSIVEKTEKYLYQKSLEIIDAGIYVIFDWGFWTQAERQEASMFFKKHSIAYEWHYIDASDEILWKNLRNRNHEIEEGKTTFYYFDDDLAVRFWDMFEVPSKGEIDIWVSDPIY